ncbi:MAG: hypothetical protein HQL66_11035, partial [Magnetococcales bacterium]|nr:hypothetical protein [Magnetococcales bacterium]
GAGETPHAHADPASEDDRLDLDDDTRQRVTRLAEDLANLLDDGNTGARSVLEELKNALPAPRQDSDLLVVETHINDYEFDTAKEILTKWTRREGIS